MFQPSYTRVQKTIVKNPDADKPTHADRNDNIYMYLLLRHSFRRVHRTFPDETLVGRDASIFNQQRHILAHPMSALIVLQHYT